MNTHVPSTRTELVSIQLLRALASLLVLLAHLQIKEKQYGDPSALVWQNFHLGSVGVDIFFVLSGFIIFFVAGHSARGWDSAGVFLKNRLIRVLPLYWALTLIALAVYLLQPELVNKTSSKPTAIWESFLLIPTDSKLLIQNGWTLSYEFLFYFGFLFAIWLLSAGSARVVFCVTAALTAVGAGLLLEPTSAAWRFATDDLLLEFAYGVLIGWAYSRFSVAGRHKLWVSVGLCALAITAVLAVLAPPTSQPFVRGLTWGIPSALIVAAGLSLEGPLQALRKLKILGDSSYSLYLSHVLTLPAAGVAWKHLNLHDKLPNYWLLAYLFVVSVTAGVVLYRYFESPLTQYLRMRFK